MNKNEEIIRLSEEIIEDFELKRIPYQNIFLKCLRLCRLTNNEIGITLFKFETSGYPHIEEKKVTNQAWEISKIAGRHYFATVDGKKQEYMTSELIGDLEKENYNTEIYLKASVDPNVSLSSSNPNQYLHPPLGNKNERLKAYQRLNRNTGTITAIVGHLYDFMLNIRNSIIYGNYMETMFESYKKDVDTKLSIRCPEAIKRLNSAYENIQTGNEQNWNNALHACRRLLEDLADSLYPEREPLLENGKTILLGKQNYKNRLIQYIKENNKSKTFSLVISSSLDKVCDELDSIYDSTNKGSHSDLAKDEAQRYLIHVYILVSDILSI